MGGELALITRNDLESAIAECQGKRNPDANTCIKLAAFYTIRNAMFGEREQESSYSYSPPPSRVIDAPGDSEFLRTVNGRDQDEVMAMVDELVSTIQVIQPRLYEAFMRKISG